MMISDIGLHLAYERLLAVSYVWEPTILTILTIGLNRIFSLLIVGNPNNQNQETLVFFMPFLICGSIDVTKKNPMVFPRNFMVKQLSNLINDLVY